MTWVKKLVYAIYNATNRTFKTGYFVYASQRLQWQRLHVLCFAFQQIY